MGLENRLLVVDDDRELCEMLAEYLRAEGIEVDVARNGIEGRDHLLSGLYDLAVLDLMLPGMNGISVLKEVRLKSDVPIIILTARGELSDRVIGLELGADDYLPKPFDPRELVARINAVMRRRTRVDNSEELRAGSIRMTPGNRAAYLAGVPVALTSIEFDLLRHIVENVGRPVSRESLAQALGRRLLSFDRSIDMHIANLRKKVGSDRIVTVWGNGYMLVVEVDPD